MTQIERSGAMLDPQMAAGVLERLRKDQGAHPADDAFSSLSPQEDRILDVVADGMTNGEIATRLQLAEKTIKNYVSQITRN